MFQTADEFYRERDRRTTEFTGNTAYQHQRVAVVLHPALAETYRGQLMFLLALNLLARYARCVTAVCPAVDVYSNLADHRSDLPGEAVSVMRAADPFGTFNTATVLTATEWGYVFQVGSGDIAGVTPTVTIDALGWRLAVTQGVSPRLWSGADDMNPVGPGAAAALGVAEAMKTALAVPRERHIERLYLSCWDYETATDPTELAIGTSFPDNVVLGHIWLIGAGMVGSALAYFLRRSQIEADLDIIDHDVVALHNLNRSPVFNVSDVGARKVSVLANYLKNCGIRPNPHAKLFSEFLADNPRNSNGVDLILPEANQYKVRAQIQHIVPPVMLHTTTSRNGGVVFGRHVPLVDECLCCRFPQDADQPDMACGSVRTITEDPQGSVDIALPFQATLAAALLVGQLYQLNMANYPFTPNYALLDALGPMRRVVKVGRPKQGGCPFCGSQADDIHEILNGRTQFAHLWREAGTTLRGVS